MIADYTEAPVCHVDDLVHFIIRIEIIIEAAHEVVVKTFRRGEFFVAGFFRRQFAGFVGFGFDQFDGKVGLGKNRRAKKMDQKP